MKRAAARSRPQTRAQPGGPNRLRIIGGQWRGRKLSFPEVPGLRPTPDRVRETVFNWLQPIVPGARCLDLYAGSGALGLEALSRGAASCTFVERDRRAAAGLEENLSLLAAEGATVVRAEVTPWLGTAPAQSYDLVFLDPPFRSDLVAPTLQALGSGWLRPGARVYVEVESESSPDLPDGWEVLKTKVAGQVGYHLLLAP